MMKMRSLLSMAALAVSVPAIAADEAAFKFNTLLQTWLVDDTTVTAAKPDFRIRRAELKFGGNTSESTRWFVMADMAKALSASDGKFLQDLGAAYMIVPGLELTAGQFKTLTTAEGLEKSSELLLPERSIVGRSYGDRREQGAMLTYKLDKLLAGMMVSNGTGPNAPDTDAKKNLTARVDYDVVEGVRVGAFTQAADFAYNKDGRTGLNARLAFGDLVASAEGVLGTVSSASSRGAQGTVAYSVAQWLQPVVRVAAYTPNTNGDAGKEYTAGLNCYVSKHAAKIQLAYTYLDNLQGNGSTGTSPGSSSYKSGVSGSLAVVSFQAAL